MHMQNELLSPPVAGVTCIVAGAGIGYICRKAKSTLKPENLPLMGLLGAFVFAAQMVNFRLPLLPGVSGHLVGGVLLAIILGPYAGSVVIASVVIVQCLIFQDGGLLAIGCNLINMAIVPPFIGYYIYRLIAGNQQSQTRMYAGAIVACLVAIMTGSALVPVQAAASNVITVPFTAFLTTMLGVHLIIGLMEGLITAAVLIYIRQVRPAVIADCSADTERLSQRAFYFVLLSASIVIGCGLSLYASEKPDGLEWSYSERPDQADFVPLVNNDSETVAMVDNLQSKYALLPDYNKRISETGSIAPEVNKPGSGAWTSFAAVLGSIVTMCIIWLLGHTLNHKHGSTNASCAN